MFRNKNDLKKYGFVLVLYLFRGISFFKSEKGDNIKLSRTGLLHKQKKKRSPRNTSACFSCRNCLWWTCEIKVYKKAKFEERICAKLWLKLWFESGW